MSKRMKTFTHDLETLGLGWLAEKLRFHIRARAGADEGPAYNDAERETLDRINEELHKGAAAPDPIRVLRDHAEGLYWAASAVILKARGLA